MTAATLLNRAQAVGLSVELEGEALRVRSPTSPADLIADIKAHEPEPITLLGGRAADAPGVPPSANSASRWRRAPGAAAASPGATAHRSRLHRALVVRRGSGAA
jgi:hypothetical protein